MSKENIYARSQNKKLISILSIFALMLFGCSSATDANKENFSKAIQDYLTQKKACFQSRNINKGLHNEFSDLNALVKVGLLKKERLAPKSALTRRIDPTILYSLTEQGKKVTKIREGLMGSVTQFCYGDKLIVDVTNFTVPSDKAGQMVSKVSYTYKITNIADWVKSESVMQQIDLREEIASVGTPLNGKATVVLTNNGWVHNKLLNK